MSLPIRELLNIGKTQLQNAGDLDAEVDAKILFCYIKNYTENEFRMAWQYEAGDDDCDKFFELVDQRCAGRPTQYITGTQNFLGNDFIVNEKVLIPRRETEVLVDDALNLIKTGQIQGQDLCKKKSQWDVLDLCTGSGVIGITIAKIYGKKVKVTASDISEEALEVAKENGNRLGVRDIKYVCGNMFEPFKGRFSTKRFDLIITNPPYIKSDVIPTLQREIKDYEPLIALDGGLDGLDYYRQIVENAHIHLKKNGVLMMEIGNEQGQIISEMLNDDGHYTKARVFQDLAGNDRVVFAAKRDKKSLEIEV